MWCSLFVAGGAGVGFRRAIPSFGIKVLLLLAGAFLVACGGDAADDATAVPTLTTPAATVATPTALRATETSEPVATATSRPATATPTSAGTPPATSTNAPSPSPTSTPEPAATDTPEPSPTAEPTSTPEPTATPEPTSTPEPTPTPEPTATPEPTPTEVQTPAGQAIFEQNCGVCHMVQGTAAQGQIGPDLTYFAGQALIADTLENNAANLWAWLADPSSVKPGTIMPNLGLSADEISLLIEFLYSPR